MCMNWTSADDRTRCFSVFVCAAHGGRSFIAAAIITAAKEQKKKKLFDSRFQYL